MSDTLKLVGGLLAVIASVLILAAAGAFRFSVFALIIGGGAYLLGFISMGTGQAVAIWILAIGAVYGVVVGGAEVLS